MVRNLYAISVLISAIIQTIYFHISLTGDITGFQVNIEQTVKKKTKYQCYYSESRKLPTDRSNHQRYSVKKVFLKILQNFTAKHLSQSAFFNKVAGLRHLWPNTPLSSGEDIGIFVGENCQMYPNVNIIYNSDNHVLIKRSHSYYIRNKLHKQIQTSWWPTIPIQRGRVGGEVWNCIIFFAAISRISSPKVF